MSGALTWSEFGLLLIIGVLVLYVERLLVVNRRLRANLRVWRRRATGPQPFPVREEP